MPRIHILGASGSGTTTLGAALASRLAVPHVDADTLFWMATDPPFTTPWPRDHRLAVLLRQLPVTGNWVFSGSATTWAKPLEPFYDLIVFLRLDTALRLERLRRREVARWGQRIMPGGDMAAASAEFIQWAAAYDTAGAEQRSLVAHEAWLVTQTAPVLRLDSSAPARGLIAAVLSKIHTLR
jgi:adenylate kinase family enzyme